MIRAIRKEVYKTLGEKHEVFLEDYWSLTHKYKFPKDVNLVEEYSNLFIKEILGYNQEESLSK